ncbi:MAG: hypothetical protein ACC651_08335 [Candidatus Scalindua sp.]
MEDKKLVERNIEVLDNLMVQVLKNKTPQERLMITFNMWRSAKKQLTNYLRSLHSEWDEKEIQQEVARRLSHGIV